MMSKYGRFLVVTAFLFSFLLPVSATAQDPGQADTLIPIEPPPVLIDTIESIIDEAEEGAITVEAVVQDTRFIPLDETAQDPYKLRQLPEARKAALKSDKDYWYADYRFDKRKPVQQQQEKERNVPFWMTDWFETLLWVLIIAAFAAILILYLYSHNAGLFRKTNRIKGEETALPDTEDIFAINYDQEISKSRQDGDFRMATRLLYLRLLRTMADKNIIRYAPNRTNLDYLMQLTNSFYYQQFFKLTRNYEYAWYGLFLLDAQKFDKVQSDFNAMQQTLNSY